MLRTTASTLALSAILAAATATATFAQTTTEEDTTLESEGEVTVIEPDGETSEADAVVIEEEPAEDVVVEEEPAEGVVIEEEPAEDVVVEEEPAEGDAATVTTIEPAETDAEVEVVEGEEAETEQPVEGQIFEQSPDQLLASTLLDATVVSPEDETIGDVTDMVLSEDGQVTGVVIGVGGFLGIGEKGVAIEYDRIEVRQGEDGELSFVLATTQEQLEAAPEFRTQDELQTDAPAPAAATDTGLAPTGTDGTMTTDPAASTAVVPQEETVEEEEVVKPAE